jgi:hypothetical protein
MNAAFCFELFIMSYKKEEKESIQYPGPARNLNLGPPEQQPHHATSTNEIQ